MNSLSQPVLTRVFACILLMGSVATSAFAAPTVINFDGVPDQSDVRNQYQAQGVTFSCDGTACAIPAINNGIYARATTPTASAPNSVTPLKTGFPAVSDTRTGRIVATFSSPVKSVSIDALTLLVPEPLNQTAYADIIAYDAAGATVASSAGNQLNAFQTLNVAASGNQIVKVSLGVTGLVAIATFDNLQFDRDPSALLYVMIILFIIIIMVVYWFFKRKFDLPRPPSAP